MMIGTSTWCGSQTAFAEKCVALNRQVGDDATTRRETSRVINDDQTRRRAGESLRVTVALEGDARASAPACATAVSAMSVHTGQGICRINLAATIHRCAGLAVWASAISQCTGAAGQYRRRNVRHNPKAILIISEPLRETIQSCNRLIGTTSRIDRQTREINKQRRAKFAADANKVLRNRSGGKPGQSTHR